MKYLVELSLSCLGRSCDCTLSVFATLLVTSCCLWASMYDILDIMTIYIVYLLSWRHGTQDIWHRGFQSNNLHNSDYDWTCWRRCIVWHSLKEWFPEKYLHIYVAAAASALMPEPLAARALQHPRDAPSGVCPLLSQCTDAVHASPLWRYNCFSCRPATSVDYTLSAN